MMARKLMSNCINRIFLNNCFINKLNSYSQIPQTRLKNLTGELTEFRNKAFAYNIKWTSSDIDFKKISLPC